MGFVVGPGRAFPRARQGPLPSTVSETEATALGGLGASATRFGGPRDRCKIPRRPNTRPLASPPRGEGANKAGGVLTTLEQACPPEYQRAQCAFKDSMIH